jgi:hypothetical protein
MFARRASLLVLFALPSCDLSLRLPGPVPECKSDSDCAPQGVCAVGACVAVAPSSLLLDLAFTPPNDSPYLKQQVAGVRVAAGSGSIPDQVLKPAVTFSGRVLAEGTDTTGLPARVEVSRDGEIAGTQVRVSGVTVTDTISGDLTFRLAVLPGIYQVVIYPDDPSYPPVRLPSPIDLTTSVVKDLVLPARTAYLTVTGKVVRLPTDRRGVAGVAVQGLDPSSPAVSTVATTDTLGHFTLVFPPGTRIYTLRAARSSDGPLIPTVDRTGVLVDGNIDIGLIVLGAYDSPVSFTGVVLGRTSGDDTAPVAGATVQLVGPVGNGTWSEQLTTDAQGQFQVSLPPARYEIDIRPPVASINANTTGVVVLSAASSNNWVLERKARLWGQVTDPDGLPASGVLVQAVRRSSLAAESAAELDIRGVDTDGVGHYDLRLDSGIYDLSFVPQGKPLARGEVMNFAMSTDDMQHDVELPEGLAAAGVVRDETGKPFVGITVEVYLDPGGGNSVPRLLGTGITDQAGRYRVVIPAR